MTYKLASILALVLCLVPIWYFTALTDHDEEDSESENRNSSVENPIQVAQKKKLADAMEALDVKAHNDAVEEKLLRARVGGKFKFFI